MQALPALSGALITDCDPSHSSPHTPWAFLSFPLGGQKPTGHVTQS